MLESASPCEGWEGETGARCARASPGLCRLISKIVLKTQRNFQCLRFRAQVRCAEGTNAARRVWRPTRKTDQQVCFGGAAQQRGYRGSLADGTLSVSWPWSASQ